MTKGIDFWTDRKRAAIMTDLGDNAHPQQVNSNTEQGVPCSDADKKLQEISNMITLLRDTTNLLILRPSPPSKTKLANCLQRDAEIVQSNDKFTDPQILAEVSHYIHSQNCTSQRTLNHEGLIGDLTMISYEEARAVGDQIGCDWTRLDEVVACFFQARLLRDQQGGEKEDLVPKDGED